MSIRTTFNQRAANYDEVADFQHEQTWRLVLQARRLLPADATVLDIGCGTGNFAHLAQNQWRISGVDMAENMVALAKQHMKEVQQGSATQLPFADAAFDAVVSSLCLQWVDDLPRAFAEIQRVLKPQGKAILITLAGDTLKELHAARLACEAPIAVLPMQPIAHYIAVAKQAGLTITANDAPIITRHYASSRALLNYMRNIGASHAASTHVGITAMRKLLRYYDTQHRDAQGVTASWQPLLLVVEKP